MIFPTFAYISVTTRSCVTVATMVGTLVAFLMVPMRSLGQDNWKIAAALMGNYIGGCKSRD